MYAATAVSKKFAIFFFFYYHFVFLSAHIRPTRRRLAHAHTIRTKAESFIRPLSTIHTHIIHIHIPYICVCACVCMCVCISYDRVPGIPLSFFISGLFMGRGLCESIYRNSSYEAIYFRHSGLGFI